MEKIQIRDKHPGSASRIIIPLPFVNWSNISRRGWKTWESCLPSLELMKTSLLHRLPQVALTCLALVTWFWGPVITQHSTRTRRYRSVARLASSASQGTTRLNSNLNQDENTIVLLYNPNPHSECGTGRPGVRIRETPNADLGDPEWRLKDK
jgi:hypothetical protein